MSSYFGNDNSSYQQPGGYYYQPYVDNGPYAQRLKEAGSVAGEAVLGTIGATAGGASSGGAGAAALAGVGALIGHYAGGSAGEAAGFYIDNISRSVDNVNTLFRELNDPNSWMTPSPFGD